MSQAVVPEALAAFSGHPEPGTWEPAFLLLTATEDGSVAVCLLSRAEIEAGEQVLYLAVASRRARANLTRTGRATLVLFASAGGLYLSLRVVFAVDDAPLTGFAFEVLETRRDEVGAPLRPLSYQVEPHLREAENWTRSAALLTRLAREHAARGG